MRLATPLIGALAALCVFLVCAGCGRSSHSGDDTPVIPEISIDSISQTEGTGPGTTQFIFTVTLSAVPATGSDVSVDWATADDTAEDENGDNDYTAANGTLVFTSSGGLTQTVTIDGGSDDFAEEDELFSVVLGTPVNGTLTVNIGMATILNDDGIRCLVDPNGDGTDGLTWTTAFITVQAGIDAAAAVGSGEVWIAAGTYTNGGTYLPVAALAPSIKLFGGFSGFLGLQETLRSQRDLAANPVILDGEVRAYHVVTGADNTVIDGVTITNGEADGTNDTKCGGGLFNADVTNQVVADCIFTANAADTAGAAMYNRNSSLTVYNCTFADNTSPSALSNEQSSPVIMNCVFNNNVSAIENTSSSPAVINCLFIANSGFPSGAMRNMRSSPTIINCTFSGNTSAVTGGIYNTESSPTITNCIFWGNAPGLGYKIDMFDDANSFPAVTYSCFEQGYPGTGNFSLNPEFVDMAGGDFRLRPSSPCIDSGSNAALPADAFDLDLDHDTGETLPCDLDEEARMVNDTGTSDTGSGSAPVVDMGAFEFQDTTALRLTAPDGGETWSVGGSGSVTWESSGIATVALELSRDSGGSWETLAVGVAGADGNYSWTVTAPGTDAALVRIQEEGGSGAHDVSRKSFNIQSALDWYVDQSVGASGTGDAWAQAFKTIQEVEAAASFGDTVHVAAGTYTRQAAEAYVLDIPAGVAMLGGYPAGGGTRDPAVNPVILDGQDVNNRIVVAGSQVTLDGFILANSNSGGYYAGTAGGLVIAGCRFINNSASSGGGIYLNRSAAIISDCVFDGNQGGMGGAVHLLNSQIAIKNGTFLNNAATNEGGGVYSWYSELTIAESTFVGNKALAGMGNGGAVYNGTYALLEMINCIIQKNKAKYGGGLYTRSNLGTVLTGCLLAENTAATAGGAIGNTIGYEEPIPCLIRNSTIVSNGANLNAGLYMIFMATAIENTVIYGNISTSGNSNVGPLTLNNDYVFYYSNVEGCGGSADWHSWFGTDSGGNIDASPQFVNIPLRAEQTNSNGTLSQLYVASASLKFNVDDVIEIEDDGIPRLVTSVFTSSIVFTPARAVSCGTGLLVENWGAGAVDLDLDLRLTGGSPCIDAGISAVVPTDALDIDNDMDTDELLPLDVEGLPRFADDAGSLDIGSGTAPIVDMGAYEFQDTTVLQLETPDGGETWDVGTTVSVDWTSSGITNVSIELSRDNGNSWEVASPSVSASLGTYAWTLSGPGTGTALIRIIELAGAGNWDCSSHAFRIQSDMDWYVDVAVGASGTGDSWSQAFQTIKEAVAAASCGDRIHVAEGIYYRQGTDYNIIVMPFGVTFLGGYPVGGGTRNPHIYNSILDGNNVGRTIAIANSDCRLDGFVFVNGVRNNGEGGALYVKEAADFIVSNCVFSGNNVYGVTRGGGAVYGSLASFEIINCSFYGNTAEYYGGAVYLSIFAAVTITNCSFAGNASRYGGSINDISNIPHKIVNSVFAENTAADEGGAWWIRTSMLSASNCICWNNSSSAGPQVFLEAESAPVWGYCIIQDSGGSMAWDISLGVDGGGNIDLDPLFADADGADDITGTADDDLRLLPGSPCIDAGDNSAVPADTADLDGDLDTAEPVPVDLDGTPRFADDPAAMDTGNGTAPVVDIGAYEYQ